MNNDEIIQKHNEKMSHYGKLDVDEQYDRENILMNEARAEEAKKRDAQWKNKIWTMFDSLKQKRKNDSTERYINRQDIEKLVSK